jgi:hypothetical protein
METSRATRKLPVIPLASLVLLLLALCPGKTTAQRQWNFLVPSASPRVAAGLKTGWDRDVAQSADFLSAEPSGWIDLMPHGSFHGWTRVPIPPENPLDPVSQWKLDREHSTIVCEGNHGHEWLRYDRELTNFLVHVEWRFEKREGLKGYNSGVFVRNDLTGRVWHQAQVGSTAYIFGQTLIRGELTPITKTAPPAVDPLHPIGEWNTYEVRCDGPKITLWVNGQLAGEFGAPEVPKGYWGLEAEGYHIEFRNIKLKILP